MAYSKTSPAQVGFQLAAGLAVGGLFYRSLYQAKQPKPMLESDQQIAARLDAEATNTSGKLWALQQQQQQQQQQHNTTSTGSSAGASNPRPGSSRQ
jgi:hypothetical protein